MLKVQGIDQAARAIVSHGYDLPISLECFCMNKIGSTNRMYGRDAQWKSTCTDRAEYESGNRGGWSLRWQADSQWEARK